ncbi:outer membrane lipase/esterase [Sphingomonas jinjuensis]|uniref:Outer membrane lipase/esterase n=1 Tax=Sphingomonas jinjuensis TaxID=535907 RepID=A0A840FMF3_9SPHN|nr:SGNH/GDSL hydrolase family protein [Sphingomonas jinjuensis]MBB4155108.1 outer membrane lipase/esterase [Sphingomonas jinjuensis]
MKAFTRTLATVALVTAPALLAATPASAASYLNLFVFGDSLVDSGNAQALRAAGGGADPAPAAAGYYQGRFSNGYNFADYIAFAIDGRPAIASAYQGTNFSVGGAQAREVAGDASPSFADQLTTFDQSGKTIDANSLVLVTFGGNDVRSELAKVGANASYQPDFTATLDAFRAGLNALYKDGARNFVVTGLPDVGQIPAVTDFKSPQLSAVGTALSRQLNTGFNARTGKDDLIGIDDIVATFTKDTGANATFFDLFAAQRQIYANPTAFGLPATLDKQSACIRVPGAVPACTGLVYFDTIHPTTQLHSAIATGIESQLGIAAVPEPATWTMMILGFAAIGLMTRRRPAVVGIAFARAA